MQIRRAGLADLAAIVALERQCFAAPWSESLVTPELTADFARAWIGEAAEGPVGYVLGWRVGDEGQINRVGVVPAQRGHGLAGELLAWALGELQREGAESVLLEVASRNAPALALYRRCGFAEIGRRKGYYDDGDAAVVMRLVYTDAAAPRTN